MWSRVDPDDFTIHRHLASREVRVRKWRMYQQGELWGERSAVEPNAAHRAVVDLWRAGRLSGVVTQNIDGLHQTAGIPDVKVAELHGNNRKTECVDCHLTWPTEEVLARVDAGEEDPRCPDCGGIVKTTTVLFGELLPTDQMQRAAMFSAQSDAVLAVGTTLSVYPAADIPLDAVRRGLPMVLVNRGPTDQDHAATVRLDGPAGTILPELVRAIITPN